MDAFAFTNKLFIFPVGSFNLLGENWRGPQPLAHLYGRQPLLLEGACCGLDSRIRWQPSRILCNLPFEFGRMRATFHIFAERTRNLEEMVLT